MFFFAEVSMSVKSGFPSGVGQIKLIYTHKGEPWNYYPISDQKHRIRLSPKGKAEIHLLKTQPWALYSHIRTHLPGHSRAYYCLGEENNRAFVARIHYGLWLAFTRRDENFFLLQLKPETIAEVEEKIDSKATRIGNLWILPLPTDWTQVEKWVSDTLVWSIVPRRRKNFFLLGQGSGWIIKLGGYTRPWHKGGESIAIAGGQIVCQEFRYRLNLQEPHLIGLTPGWQY